MLDKAPAGIVSEVCVSSLCGVVQVGQCQTLHVMSVRENELCELPEELGSLKELRVLDIIGNRIRCLPISFSNLQLDAFWIDSSQVKGG